MKLAYLLTLLVSGFAVVSSTSDFEGYYMGIDPVDGGDSRASIYKEEDGTYKLLRRDSYITLCGGTDLATLEASGTVDDCTGYLVLDGETTCLATEVSLGVQLIYEKHGDGALVEDL